MEPERDSTAGMTDDELRAAIAERDSQRDPERAHAIIDHVLTHSPDDLAAGLEALLIGNPDTVRLTGKGAEEPFWSVKARQLDLLSLLLNRLIAALVEKGLYPLWAGGGPDFDRDVARALWQLGDHNGSPAPDTKPDKAMALAQVIHRYLEIARNQQNKEGGYHHAFPGAQISGSHDALKLVRAGKAQWSVFIRPLLQEKTFEGKDPIEFLGKAWEALRKGIDDDLYLYFKDADSWTAYNLRFGLGTLRDAVVVAMERAARRTGLFAVFGRRPQHWLEGILQAFEKGEQIPIDAAARSRLQAILTALAPTWQFSEDSGRIDRTVSAISREGLLHLGESLFSQNEDLPAFGEAVPYQKATLQEAIDVELGAFVSGKGVTRAEGRPGFAMGVAVFAENFNAVLMDRFLAFDNPPGRTAELLRQFLKLNVSHWRTEVTRRAAFSSLSAFLGQALTVGFADVDPDFKATLALYGVGAGDWEAVRATMGIADTGTPPSSASVQAAKAKLNEWLWDRFVLAVLPADEPDHAKLCRGVTDLTGEGQLLRFIAQFRDFRAPFLPKPNQTVDPNLADHIMRPVMPGEDALPALSGLLVWTILFARLNRFSFDVIEGEAPAIGKDEWPWFEAANIGGALGFCADILFGETTGMKELPLSALGQLKHPSVNSVLRVWRRARDGDDVRSALAAWAEREGDPGAFDTLQTTRQALDFALLHWLQGMLPR